MRRYGNLYPQITDFENLLLASRKAQKGKRYRDNILEFNYHLEYELLQLQQELATKTYQPGSYRTFHIRDPKSRLISAAPYRDRVVHHALCNVIVPIFEKEWIADTYANRKGYGTHRALRRFTQFARSSRYVLQCDIRKYFPSIDHEILKALISHKIKCPNTLWLIDSIIDNSNEQEPVIQYFRGDDMLTPALRRHGIPIGNLTSQTWANVYLSGFDHWIKEKLKVRQYIRYVDDFSLFSDDRSFLVECLPAIVEYLAQLRLKIHPVKTQLFECKQGCNFLGFRIFPNTIRVKNENLRRARKRVKRLQKDFNEDKIGVDKINQSIQSWVAHLAHGDTWRLRHQIFADLVFTRGRRRG